MSKEWSKEVFSRNLRRYMKRSGKNQKELANIIGVSPTAFNRWLNCDLYPRIDKIEKIAEYFEDIEDDDEYNMIVDAFTDRLQDIFDIEEAED